MPTSVLHNLRRGRALSRHQEVPRITELPFLDCSPPLTTSGSLTSTTVSWSFSASKPAPTLHNNSHLHNITTTRVLRTFLHLKGTTTNRTRLRILLSTITLNKCNSSSSSNNNSSSNRLRRQRRLLQSRGRLRLRRPQRQQQQPRRQWHRLHLRRPGQSPVERAAAPAAATGTAAAAAVTTANSFIQYNSSITFHTRMFSNSNSSCCNITSNSNSSSSKLVNSWCQVNKILG